MGLISPTLPSSGQDRGTEEIDVLNCLTALLNLVNGSLDTANLNAAAGVTAAQLASAIKQQIGVNDGSTVRRGKSIIATEETRTNVAYGTMTTPDQVTGVVLPTDGLLCIAFQAQAKSSIANAGSAAIFLGANQLKSSDGSASPVAQSASFNSTANVYRSLAATGNGVISLTNGATAYTGDVTTGQHLGLYGSGGPLYVFAAAGTYDVSVQYKATSGSVSAMNRKLWVWALGF